MISHRAGMEGAQDRKNSDNDGFVPVFHQACAPRLVGIGREEEGEGAEVRGDGRILLRKHKAREIMALAVRHFQSWRSESVLLFGVFLLCERLLEKWAGGESLGAEVCFALRLPTAA